jgi:hypothetical protein
VLRQDFRCPVTALIRTWPSGRSNILSSEFGFILKSL